MIAWLIVAVYCAVGIWVALVMLAEFTDERDWLAVAPVVVALWFPGVVALIAVRIYHEVRMIYWRLTR